MDETTIAELQDSIRLPPVKSHSELFDRFMSSVLPKARNPLNDPRIRKAIRHLLAPATTVDSNAAKRLLFEAGYPNGFSIELSKSLLRFNPKEETQLRTRLHQLNIKVIIVE